MLGAVTFLFDLDSVTFDLLIERRQRNVEIVGRFRLAPSAPFEHFDDDALFDGIHDVEQRTFLGETRMKTALRISMEGKAPRPAARPVDHFGLRQHDGTLDNVFQFANIAGPVIVHQGLQGLRTDAIQRLAHFPRSTS